MIPTALLLTDFLLSHLALFPWDAARHPGEKREIPDKRMDAGGYDYPLVKIEFKATTAYTFDHASKGDPQIGKRCAYLERRPLHPHR